jgi:predicted nucleic acid-binding protein
VNVIDSSAWLEYFADGANATFFARAIQDPENLLVPTITLFEVFQRVRQQRGDGAALQVIAAMQEGAVVDLDARIAIAAAKLSADVKLPLADSVVLATARAHGATLWTQDGDFEGMDDVEFRSASR